MDEWDHYFRALMISQGNFYDEKTEDGTIGGTISDNIKSYLQVYKGDRGISLKNIVFKNSDFLEGFSESKSFIKNIYFSSRIPTGHTLPAIGVFLGRVLFNNFFLSVILGRLCVYIFYCTVTYYAMKNVKYYKSIFFVTATIPISFWLAGTINTDPILNAGAFMFISICLKYMFEKNKETYISKKDLILITVCAIILITCKYYVGIPILLLFFFIPVKKFKSKKHYITYIILAIILGILLISWQFLMLNKFEYVEDRNGYVNQGEQILYIKNNIFEFTKMFTNEFLNTINIGLENFSYDGVLACIANSTGLILVVTAILEKNKNKELKANKIFNIASVLIFCIVTIVSMIGVYTSYTPVGKNSIDGFQIRYMILPMLLLLIPLSNIVNVKNEIKSYNNIVLFVILISNLDLVLGEIVKAFSTYVFWK